MARAGRLVVILAIVGVGVFFLIQFLRRPVPTGDPEELPLIGHQVAAHMDSAVVKRPVIPPAPKQEPPPAGPGLGERSPHAEHRS